MNTLNPFNPEFMLLQHVGNDMWFMCPCVVLPASTRSSSSVLMNLMMSDENNRDIYITIASMPPPKPCSYCCPVPSATTIRTGKHTFAEMDYFIVLTASVSLTHQTSSVSLHRKWWVFGTWLCTQQQVPGGVPVPHFPTCFPAEEGPGHPVKHELLSGGVWHLTLPR